MTSSMKARYPISSSRHLRVIDDCGLYSVDLMALGGGIRFVRTLCRFDPQEGETIRDAHRWAAGFAEGVKHLFGALPEAAVGAAREALSCTGPRCPDCRQYHGADVSCAVDS